MNRSGVIFIGLGIELIILVIGSLYLGKIIDNKMGWPGYGALGTFTIVIMGWFYHLMVLMKKYMEEEDDDTKG